MSPQGWSIHNQNSLKSWTYFTLTKHFTSQILCTGRPEKDTSPARTRLQSGRNRYYHLMYTNIKIKLTGLGTGTGTPTLLHWQIWERPLSEWLIHGRLRFRELQNIFKQISSSKSMIRVWKYLLASKLGDQRLPFLFTYQRYWYCIFIFHSNFIVVRKSNILTVPKPYRYDNRPPWPDKHNYRYWW
jgi:hypothetical protein